MNKFLPGWLFGVMGKTVRVKNKWYMIQATYRILAKLRSLLVLVNAGVGEMIFNKISSSNVL